MGTPTASASSLQTTHTPDVMLHRLQAERLPKHPLVQAARQQLEQALAIAHGVAGYFDTQVYLAGGGATWNRPIPGSALGAGLGSNRYAIRSGIEQAVQPGLFVAAGIAESLLTETSEMDRDMYQTLAGLSAGIPLLRNRGHAQWRTERHEADALVEAARQNLLAVLQHVRRESDAAWIDLLQAAADADAFRLSGDRVTKLLEETETLVSLKAIPEYQLFPSRLDHALREEEIAIAEQRVESIRLRLETFLGELPDLPAASLMLPAWAGARLLDTQTDSFATEQIERHGSLAAMRAQIRAAHAAEARARDAAAPDLHLSLSTTWQAESYDQALGDEALTDDDTVGVEAALILQVPLQRRREKAAWQAEAARAAAIESSLAHERRLLLAQFHDARQSLATTRRRMDLVSHAVDNARLTLEAESDRFRLGEGRSRNVLDAQKDLTAAELRRNAAAAALLQAAAAFEFAAAYPDGLLPEADAVPEARELIALCHPDKEVP